MLVWEACRLLQRKDFKEKQRLLVGLPPCYQNMSEVDIRYSAGKEQHVRKR